MIPEYGSSSTPKAQLAHKLAARLHWRRCEGCGAKKVHAHHPDYDKPVDVKWLCASCHHQEHAMHAEWRIHLYGPRGPRSRKFGPPLPPGVGWRTGRWLFRGQAFKTYAEASANFTHRP